MRFKIDWSSLKNGRKFTVFALFYFVFEGNSEYKPPEGFISGERFNKGFFALRVLGGLNLERLIFGILR